MVGEADAIADAMNILTNCHLIDRFLPPLLTDT